MTQLQKDIKLVQKCLHKKLLWSKASQKPVTSVSEQFIPLPLALCNNEGLPLKGQKSFATTIFEKRYEKAIPQVVLNALPSGWIPEYCILEGMFMINTSPIGTHKTICDYGDFLFVRFIVPQWLRGSKEVHIIFENPGRIPESPKQFERTRRDDCATVISNHVCSEITNTSQIPSKWRDNFINCRNCKRKLVLFLTNYFLQTSGTKMQPGKVLLIAGGFCGSIEDTAWAVTSDQPPYPNPLYTCNSEETDTRMWLHVKQTEQSNILIMSPDTDCYHIGMPLNYDQPKDVIVQLNKYTSKEIKFLHLPALLQAIGKDPDLSFIPNNLLPQMLCTLFVVTGCDYTSFFSRIGKTTFYRYLFQHTKFITSGELPGTLADIGLRDNSFEMGFLSFLRLVGVTYFKKNNSGFSQATPEAHFHSFSLPDQTPLCHHKL